MIRGWMELATSGRFLGVAALAFGVGATACTRTVTEIVERSDTVRVTDTVRVADTVVARLATYRLEPVASDFALPVTVQADGNGLLVAQQGGRIVRPNGSLAYDLSALVPTDLNFVGGLLNLLVADGRAFVFLTTADAKVLVGEVRAARLDTLVLASGFGVQHHGGGLALHRGRLLVGFGDGDTGTGRGPGLNGRLVAIDLTSRERTELARGLRNPWRMALRGDSLWIADAGDRAWEEIDVLDLNRPPVDFGWGVSEGPVCAAGASCTGVTWPRYAYPTGPDCSTVVGAAWFEDRFWFGDYCESWIRSLGGSTATGDVAHHFDLDDRIVALAQTAAGSAPYVVTAGGRILRIVRGS